jgi:hypothetical protein
VPTAQQINETPDPLSWPQANAVRKLFEHKQYTEYTISDRINASYSVKFTLESTSQRFDALWGPPRDIGDRAGL